MSKVNTHSGRNIQILYLEAIRKIKHLPIRHLICLSVVLTHPGHGCLKCLSKRQPEFFLVPEDLSSSPGLKTDWESWVFNLLLGLHLRGEANTSDMSQRRQLAWERSKGGHLHPTAIAGQRWWSITPTISYFKLSPEVPFQVIKPPFTPSPVRL